MDLLKFVGFLLALFSIVFFGAYLQTRKEALDAGQRGGGISILVAAVAMLLLGLYLFFR